MAIYELIPGPRGREPSDLAITRLDDGELSAEDGDNPVDPGRALPHMHVAGQWLAGRRITAHIKIAEPELGPELGPIDNDESADE